MVVLLGTHVIEVVSKIVKCMLLFHVKFQFACHFIQAYGHILPFGPVLSTNTSHYRHIQTPTCYPIPLGSFRNKIKHYFSFL